MRPGLDKAAQCPILPRIGSPVFLEEENHGY